MTKIIEGKVAKILDEYSMVINVGRNDGVTEGMVFVIYRGLDYIGDLKVGVVEPNQAAGRLIRSAGSPRVGDQVADEARFGMAR